MLPYAGFENDTLDDSWNRAVGVLTGWSQAKVLDQLNPGIDVLLWKGGWPSE